MWLFLIGIVVQMGVLFSFYGVLQTPPRPPEVTDEVCVHQNGTAERLVLLIVNSIRPRLGAARARVNFGPNPLQWNAIGNIIYGTPERCFLGSSADNEDSIVAKTDVVVYSGPTSVFRWIGPRKNLFANVYEDSATFSTDYDGFYSIFDVLKKCSRNSNFPELTHSGKTLFIFYASTSALSRPKIRSDGKEVRFLKDLASLETEIHSAYPDGKTIFVTIPDFRYCKEPEDIQIWGWGISEGYHSPIALEDLSAFISTTLGIKPMRYSQGRFPDNILQINEDAKAMGLFCNALQLHKLAFGSSRQKKEDNLRKDLFTNSSETIRKSAEELIQCALKELNCSKGKVTSFIFSSVSVTLVGWMLVIISEINAQTNGFILPPRKCMVGICVFIVCFLVSCTFLLFFVYAYNFYDILYFNFAVLPFSILMMRYKLMWFSLKKVSVSSLMYLPLLVLLSESLVLSLDDEFWSLLVLSVVPILSVFPYFKSVQNLYLSGWCAVSFLAGLLVVSAHLVPPGHSVRLLNVSSVAWMCLGGCSFLLLRDRWNAVLAGLLVAQLLLAAVLSVVSQVIGRHVVGMDVAAWILTCGFLWPLLGRRRFAERAVHLALAFAAPIALQARNLELLSYAVLLAYTSLSNFLELSFMNQYNKTHHQIRRGFLLLHTLCLAYLLMGKLEYNKFYQKDILILYSNTFDHSLHAIIIALKYILVFATVMFVYVSLVKTEWPRDTSFLYGYLLVELVCLRSYAQFYFRDKPIADEMFRQFTVNMFVLFMLVSYCLAITYSAPLDKDKKHPTDEVTPTENIEE